MPNRLRSIVVEPSKPVRWPTRGSSISPVFTTFIWTGFVTPWSVRSPVTFHASVPAFSTFVLLKVISGYCSTSKKSAERRC